MPRPPGVQQQMPVPPPTDLPNAQVAGFTEAVTKGVEAAMKNIIAGGYFSPNLKQCPRRRKVQVKEVEEVREAESKDEHYFMLVSRCEKEALYFADLMIGKGMNDFQGQVRLYEGHRIHYT